MLVIRMQRTGRKGHAMFRVVVQDSRQTPTSGKVVAHLGNYDPHAKTLNIDKEKAAHFLEHGAQPSDRAVRLLKSEGVKLPKWVKDPAKKERVVRNPDKRRSTAPEKPAEEQEKPAEEPAAEAAEAEAPAEEAPADDASEAPAEPANDKPADDNADDAVSEDDKAEEPSATEEKPAAETADDADSAPADSDDTDAK